MGIQFNSIKQSNKNMKTSAIFVFLFCLLTLATGFTRFQTSCTKVDFDGTKTTRTLTVEQDGNTCSLTNLKEECNAQFGCQAISNISDDYPCNSRPKCRV